MSRSSPRTILHVDMDAFYASVEQRDNPELRGRPVAVGGQSKRGVVAAASYEARKFGVRSAMPGRTAARLCPSLIFVRSRMDHYRDVSKQVFAIFSRYSPLIEGLSLDEAFLDVTGSRRIFGNGESIAKAIKHAIRGELDLVASVGVAANKFLAKLASDLDKPDGLCVVPEHSVTDFLDPLPIARLWGVGPKTRLRFEEAGIRTFGALRLASPAKVAGVVGERQAHHLQRLVRGEDDREVVSDRPEKSISHEETYKNDLKDPRHIRAELLGLAGKVGMRLRDRGLQCKTVVVKIRTANFDTYTRSRTLTTPTAHDRDLYSCAMALFTQWSKTDGRPVRLLGVGASGLAPVQQADLFASERSDGLEAVSDAVRKKFGGDRLLPAAAISKRSEKSD